METSILQSTTSSIKRCLKDCHHHSKLSARQGTAKRDTFPWINSQIITVSESWPRIDFWLLVRLSRWIFFSFFWEFKGGDWCIYYIYWVVATQIFFCFHPENGWTWGKWSNLTDFFSNGLKPPTSTCIFLDGNWWFPYIPWWIGVWVYLVGVRIPNHRDTMRALQKCLLIVFRKLNDVWTKTLLISCQINTCFYYLWKRYDWVKWTWRFLFPR